MKISGIAIHDTFGTRDFQVPEFSVLRISGHNGSGKSSILRALGYVFAGGTDPSVIRKGSEQSVVRIDLDNGAYFVKTTRPKRARKGGPITGYVATLEGFAPDGTPIPSPQTQLNELADSMAIDPSVLLRIDASTVPGRRALAAELVKLIPITFTPVEVGAACAYRSSETTPVASALALEATPKAPLSLDDLKKTVASVTEMRRREGQTRDAADGAVKRLLGALPETVLSPDGIPVIVDDASIRASLEKAEEYRRDVEAAISDRKLEIEKAKGGEVADATTAWSAAVKSVNDDIDAQIKALELQRTERCNAARAALDGRKAAAEDTAKRALADLAAESQPALEQAIAQVTTAKDAIASYARAATLREEIEVQRAAHQAASWTYDQLSEVLKRLEALRLDKIQRLPVDGFGWSDDGFPCLDGVEWQNVNLARRVEAVLQICTQQAGKLPLILIDDCEHMDSETRNAIEQGLVDAGYQVIEAVVGDGPLTIETVAASALQEA